MSLVENGTDSFRANKVSSAVFAQMLQSNSIQALMKKRISNAEQI